jgi:hypothetical protein
MTARAARVKPVLVVPPSVIPHKITPTPRADEIFPSTSVPPSGMRSNGNMTPSTPSSRGSLNDKALKHIGSLRTYQHTLATPTKTQKAPKMVRNDPDFPELRTGLKPGSRPTYMSAVYNSREDKFWAPESLLSPHFGMFVGGTGSKTGSTNASNSIFRSPKERYESYKARGNVYNEQTLRWQRASDISHKYNTRWQTTTDLRIAEKINMCFYGCEGDEADEGS